MKVVIAGTRAIDATNADHAVASAMAKWCDFFGDPTVVISGRCRGIDVAGERWAHARGIPVEAYPAEWLRHGRAAGPMRNREMVERGEGLVAIPLDGSDGTSGTAHCIRLARAAGLPVLILDAGHHVRGRVFARFTVGAAL